MLAIKGVYKNGKIFLRNEIETKKSIDVIVTFLENIETTTSERLDLNKFSFAKSKELLKNFKGSLSDALIEERRSAI